jgi:hypothetical protein
LLGLLGFGRHVLNREPGTGKLGSKESLKKPQKKIELSKKRKNVDSHQTIATEKKISIESRKKCKMVAK